MFKLPLLQPQLTGVNGIEKKDGQSVMAPFLNSGARSAKESDLAAAVAAAQTATFEVRSWSRQAKDITTDLTGSDKYKSLALHAEVKLAEALERCDRVSPVTHTPAGEERPSKLRTAVTCQLLAEFGELCGPFAGVLAKLREELLKSIYSWYYCSERGGLAFDQLPWFAVAERLEREKEALTEERESFMSQIQQQQDAVSRIEEQVAGFRRASEAAQLEAAALRTHLERLTVSEELARLEAKTGREELRKLRKEALKLRDDLEAEKASHSRLQDRHAELTEFSVSKITELERTTSAALVEAGEARRLADSRVPPEVFDKLKSTLVATQSELETVSGRVRDLEAVNAKLAGRLDVMTPRPKWRKLGDHNIQGPKRTAELVHRVEERLGRYASELDELKARLTHAAALLQPDPAPAEVQLSLVTDASTYFLTEGGDDGGGGTTAAGANATAEPCGLAASVPRCLRWPQRVPLQALTLEQTEALVMAIWKAKQAMGVTATTGSLQSFLYYYFTPQGLASADSVKLSYSFYHAAATHAKSSPLVRTFWLVLTGQAAEAAHTDQQAMVSGLASLLHALTAGGRLEAGAGNPTRPGSAAGAGGQDGPGSPSTSGSADGSVRLADVAAALDRYFPARPSFRLHKLRDALHSQFPGEAASLDALLAALQPHGLQPPPPSSAPATAKACRFSADLLTKPAAPLGPLLHALLSQHIDEVEALCMELATAMAEVAAAPGSPQGGGGHEAEVGTEGLVEVSALAARLGDLLGPPRALAMVMDALGYSVEDYGGAAVRSGGAGGGSGSGVMMPVGQAVDAADVGRQVLLRCLVKPEGNYDVAGAVRWARNTFGAAAA